MAVHCECPENAQRDGGSEQPRLGGGRGRRPRIVGRVHLRYGPRPGIRSVFLDI